MTAEEYLKEKILLYNSRIGVCHARKYGELKAKEAVEALIDKDVRQYLKENTFCPEIEIENECICKKCEVMFLTDVLQALSMQAANFEKKAIEAFREATKTICECRTKIDGTDRVCFSCEMVLRFKEQLKSKF